jgi:hypothetical protein
MGLVDVIKVQIDRFANEVIGFTTSPVYRLYDNALDAWFWVIDVDLDTASSNPNANAREGLIAVPIADPSREVFAADIGTQVKLVRRVEDQRYVVSGLSKYANGTLSICLVYLPRHHDTLWADIEYDWKPCPVWKHCSVVKFHRAWHSSVEWGLYLWDAAFRDSREVRRK